MVDAVRHDRTIDEVCERHGIPARDFRRWRDELLDGVEASRTEPDQVAPPRG